MLPPRSDPPEWLGRLEPRDQTYTGAERLAHEFRALFLPDRLEDAALDLPQVLSIGPAS